MNHRWLPWALVVDKMLNAVSEIPGGGIEGEPKRHTI